MLFKAGRCPNPPVQLKPVVSDALDAMTMNFVTFNQDYSYLAVGMVSLSLQAFLRARLTILSATSKGFRVFTTDPFSKCYETKDGNIAIIEMLFSTSLVALILSPRRLQIANTKVRRMSP